MRGDPARYAGLGGRFAAGALAVVCLLAVACSDYKYVRTENPLPDIDIRINGKRMDVRSAVYVNYNSEHLLFFFSRAVNCDEVRRGLDKGGPDTVRVCIYPRPISLTGLTVGGRRAGPTIREPKLDVTEIYASPPSLWPESLEGTLDVASSTLEIRGKFTTRGCGITIMPL
jgi:hypothetical protein